MSASAIGAALLLTGVAGFQVAVALGAPWGEMAYGGRVETTGGVLPDRYRAMSASAVAILLFAAWVILARADVVPIGPLSGGFVRAAAWVVTGYLVLNTVMKAAARTSMERWAMGSVTAVAAVLSFVVAAG